MKKHATKCKKKPCTCDGYHTFSELYEHRIRLFIELCRSQEALCYWSDEDGVSPWCSKVHSDGTKYDGWFVLGLGKESGKQITYHLPLKYWKEVTNFAVELEKAPKFDGHTPDDVLKRLKSL